MAEKTGSFFTLGTLAECSKGRIALGSVDFKFRGVSVDSRKCAEDSLYVPIYGERVDGHDYIGPSFDSGAAGTLASESFWSEKGEEIVQKYPGKGVVIVENPLKALQETAGLFRERYLSDTVRVGITGSSGKTTMKELLGAVLNEYRPTSMNSGNLNSDIGLPMAVLSIDPSATYSVLEMGMNYQGEMDILSNIYRPEVGVVTNIGTAHVGMLGSVENIAREKMKIFRYLDSSGAAFVWEDEPWFNFLTKGLNAPVFRYGRNSTPDFQEARDQGLGGWLLKIGGRMVNVPLMGEHNLQNILGAVSVARYLGAGIEDVVCGLGRIKPLFGRGEVIEGTVTMIVDCYNANPDSFSAGIDVFASIPWQGRKIVVAGSMGELGDDSRKAHKSLGAQIARHDFDETFFFGEECRKAFESFTEEALDEKGPTRKGTGFWSEDYSKLEAAVVNYLRPGDLVFIKGSRAMELERLVKPIGRNNV
ncbi:MAG: UDP-N-acetylmuramoyl-tripeptide--D-alanyl-D-alanine ligase [Spirochaetales bacterium]|nr:UDP-N-acetylmuramoyl-tripeptide--D-alanyl-D-alanine ligase [Spirochaetales bacterium]